MENLIVYSLITIIIIIRLIWKRIIEQKYTNRYNIYKVYQTFEGKYFAKILINKSLNIFVIFKKMSYLYEEGESIVTDTLEELEKILIKNHKDYLEQKNFNKIKSNYKRIK